MRKPRSIKRETTEPEVRELPKMKPVVPKNQLTSLKSFLEYCDGNEVFSFETQSEASDFGEKIRVLAKQEEGAKTIYDLKSFDVSIGALTVRIKLVEQS